MVNQGKVTFFFLLLNHEICTQTRTGPRTKTKLTEPTSNLEKITKHLGYASSGPSVPWRENKDLDSSSFALPQVILHLLIYYNNLSIHTKKGAAINPFYVHVGACWSSGMILASGARGPGFDSRTGPFWQTCEVKDKTYLLF